MYYIQHKSCKPVSKALILFLLSPSFAHLPSIFLITLNSFFLPSLFLFSCIFSFKLSECFHLLWTQMLCILNFFFASLWLLQSLKIFGLALCIEEYIPTIYLWFLICSAYHRKTVIHTNAGSGFLWKLFYITNYNVITLPIVKANPFQIHRKAVSKCCKSIATQWCHRYVHSKIFVPHLRRRHT